MKHVHPSKNTVQEILRTHDVYAYQNVHRCIYRCNIYMNLSLIIYEVTCHLRMIAFYAFLWTVTVNYGTIQPTEI